jgi:hypothetical protein
MKQEAYEWIAAFVHAKHQDVRQKEDSFYRQKNDLEISTRALNEMTAKIAHQLRGHKQDSWEEYWKAWHRYQSDLDNFRRSLDTLYQSQCILNGQIVMACAIIEKDAEICENTPSS